jgi:hypothetical protein
MMSPVRNDIAGAYRRGQVIAFEHGPTGDGMSPMVNGRRQPSSNGMSRMMREYQVWFCEGLGVKFPGPTRRQPVDFCIRSTEEFDPNRSLASTGSIGRTSQVSSQAIALRGKTSVVAAAIGGNQPKFTNYPLAHVQSEVIAGWSGV